MKIGAEPKKIAILVVLLLVAVVVLFTNSSSTPEASYTPPPAASQVGSPALGSTPETAAAPAGTSQQRGRLSTEFRPSVRPKRGEQRPDPMTIDPTLRLDLLTKLQSIEVEGSHRSIFDFSQAPPPKPDPVKAAAAKPPVPSPIVPDKPANNPEQAKVEPAKPKAPPIPLKFFGYVSPSGAVRRAFFVEGDEIHVVREGEVVKRRYKVVRIGVNSVVVEDTQFGSQQTLPLEEQQQG
jgi:hypothetical protein